MKANGLIFLFIFLFALDTKMFALLKNSLKWEDEDDDNDNGDACNDNEQMTQKSELISFSQHYLQLFAQSFSNPKN